MTTTVQLSELLAKVRYNSGVSAVEGLDPFRRMLENDADGAVLDFLKLEAPGLPDKIRGGIVFVLSEHYFKVGDMERIRALFASGDPETREATLGALWGDPTAFALLGTGVVDMAIKATSDSAEGVRTEACRVLQNQCAWKVDVSQAIRPLTGLLKDSAWRVRHQAAYAGGNFAAQKQYDLTGMVQPLTRNLAHENIYVRVASAWALSKLVKRHDISPAVSQLTETLTSKDDYNAARKNAAGALLAWAKRSKDHAQSVQAAIAGLPLDRQRKEVARFLRELEALDRT